MTPFVNKDAQYLYDLSLSYERDDLQVCVELQAIAHRLERLDERVLNLQSMRMSSDYERGVHDAYERVYARSNLATPEEITQAMQNAQLIKSATVPIKRIAPAKAAPPAKPSQLSLAGIKLDLSTLKLKVRQ